MKKIGLYFFIVATMLSIIDGSLKIASLELEFAKYILLVLSGIIVGLFILSREKDFMLSGVSFIIAGTVLLLTLGQFFVLSIFGKILANFILFISSAVVAMAFKHIINIISEEAGIESKRHEGVTIHHLVHFSFEKLWGIIILVAVAVAILQLLMETFYDISAYTTIIEIVDAIIFSLFLVDLVILYEKAESFKKFIVKDIFDILAAIPIVGIFRAFKIIRAVKIIRIFKSGSVLSRMVKLSRTRKFFSEKSAVSQYTTSVKKKTSIKKKSLKKKVVKKKTKKKVVKKKSLKRTSKSKK